MAIRRTESKIPGGFDNISALGYAIKDAENRYALVSFLGKTLRLGFLGKYNKNFVAFKNQYVVFIDTSQVNKVTDYKYRLAFFNEKKEEVWVKNGTKQIGVFSFSLKEEDIIEIQNKLAIECKFKVEISNGSNKLHSLELIHNVKGLRKDLEEVILTKAGSKKFLNAYVGNKVVFRLVGNYLADYIQDAYLNEPETYKETIPPELLTAIVYQNITEKITNHILAKQNHILAKELNSNENKNSKKTILKNVTGICNLKPAFAGMFIPKEHGTSFLPKIVIPANKNSKTILKQFRQLPKEEKIDIYNLLRFPKSNLKICLLSLISLKAHHNVFSQQSLSLSTFINKNDKPKAVRCVKNIVSELFHGLYEKIKQIPLTGLATQVSVNIYNEKIQKLSFTYLSSNKLKDTIAFKEIKIQVLDIRSGKPIRNAKVKRLVLKLKNQKTLIFINDKKENKELFETEFRAIVGHNLKSEARSVLTKLGYFKPKEFTKSINAYWNDRGKNYQITRNSSIEEVQYVIEEYRLSSETNENGIVKVRIPYSILNAGVVKIEIGFWDFPIILEELKNPSNKRRISRQSINETPTKFIVEWTGGQFKDSNQTLNWDKHILEEEYFGWKVGKHDKNEKYPLKVAELLEVQNSNNNFSKFYETGESKNHFILFGLQWCQPIWDELNDQIENGIEKTYIQDNRNKNKHLHFVTYGLQMGGFDLYNGKGYGKFENGLSKKKDTLWRSANGHQGYDFYAQDGYLTFALRGGKYTATTLSKTSKHKRHVFGSIKWESIYKYKTVLHNKNKILKEINLVQYLHLKEHKATNNTYVMAGQIIALIGRTGNIGLKSKWPTHLHLNVGSTPTDANERKYYPKLLETIQKLYTENNNIILNNNNSPLVFPCFTETTDENNNLNASGCKFNKKNIASNCWAVAELKCPHMHTNNRSIWRLQALLRYLNEKSIVEESLKKSDKTRVKDFIVEANKIAKIKKIDIAEIKNFNLIKTEIRNQNRNQKIFNPEIIDGKMGNALTTINNSKLSKNTEVTTSELYDNRTAKLNEIEFKNKNGKKIQSWIDGTLIEDGKVIETIDNLPQNKPTKTQFSIYTFKKEYLTINYLNYYNNFQMDNNAWIKLEEVLNLNQ